MDQFTDYWRDSGYLFPNKKLVADRFDDGSVLITLTNSDGDKMTYTLSPEDAKRLKEFL